MKTLTAGIPPSRIERKIQEEEGGLTRSGRLQTVLIDSNELLRKRRKIVSYCIFDFDSRLKIHLVVEEDRHLSVNKLQTPPREKTRSSILDIIFDVILIEPIRTRNEDWFD